MNEKTITLFRPTGPKELELVAHSGYQCWPPRLPEQPFFYPVSNQAYAEQITKQWNVKDYGVGYVTKFLVKSAFLAHYEIKQVGNKQHSEWWIPAANLDELNENIVGLIEVVGEFS